MCVVAGPNGSGKTTTTELLLANEWGANSLYINPDNIAEHEFGGWNSPDAVMKAAQRATESRYQCLEKGRDKQQIVDLIESEDDYDMLTAISIADATAVNGFWGKRIISGAAAMKGEVMKLKNG